MIKIGQMVSFKKQGKLYKGKVVFVNDNGTIASFKPEGANTEIFFHESLFGSNMKGGIK